MAGFVFVVLILAMAGHSSATWCVCKEGLSDAVLQKALDYACGAGADCNPIHQNAACYNPNNIRAHCNYAVNSYFQKKGQAAGTCDFAGCAAVTTSDPSITGCVYPSSASSTGTSTTTTTPVTTTPSTTTPMTPTTTTPIGGSPYVTTPSTGVLGGVGTGLGPTGSGINDESHGGVMLQKTSIFTFLITLIFPGLVFLCG